MNHTGPKLPFPFSIIPYIIMIVWLSILGLLGWSLYLLATSGVGPEDIGSFFAKIVNGFQKEGQP